MAFIFDDLLVFVSEKLLEACETQMYDMDKVNTELMDLQALLEAEAITEEEYDTREKALLGRMEEIRQYQNERQGR